MGWDDTYVATVDALRTAVTTADDSTFICITESLALTGGQLDVDDTTLTITGRDDSEVTIDLGGNRRFIDAYLGLYGPDDTLTVAHLTIENGYSPDNGGAIRVRGDGALLVESSRFTGNQTTYGDGGALWSDVPLEVRNSQFTSNRSPDTRGNGGRGGAIYAGRPLELSGNSFTGNFSYEDGGAIFGDSTVTVSESYFTGNQAYGQSGGAIYVVRDAAISASVFVDNYAGRGGGAVNAGRSVTVEDCAFNGNDADGIAGAALYVRQRSSDASVVTSSSFIFNGDDARPTYGGGVFKYQGGLVISNSLFFSNYASKGGAVSLYNVPSDDTITYTTIIDNYAATSGGGIFLIGSNPRVNVQNSILWANESPGSLTGDDSDIDANGADVTLRNSTYTDANSISGITPTDSVAGDPLLPPPSDNGGPVIGSDDSTTFLPTTIPGTESPAIGIADSSLLPAVLVDQIGVTRTSRTAGAMNAPPNPTPPPPTPTFPPSAPSDVTGRPGDASATVTWTAPVSPGSFAITHYEAVARPGGSTCLVTAPTTGCTLTGLTNGTTYTVTVRALNGAGWGATATSGPVTPRPAATRPGPVQDLTVVEVTAAGTIELTWQPPLDDGGSPVTSYRVRYRQVGTEDYIRIRPNTPDTSITVTGLTPGQRYWVRVAARNDVGHGPGTRTNPRVRIPTE